MATKRLWRSASVSFGFGVIAALRGMKGLIARKYRPVAPEPELGLCRAYLDTCDEILGRGKSQQQVFQDESGVVVDGLVGTVTKLPLRGHDDVGGLEFVENALPDKGFHEAS